ncbi:chemotaxis protein CheW [Desulfococcaceae bacterium HSG8]|nr:chemotaxis protein CheW [Desulfococcaceae bacterium HSG8]
MRRNKYADTKRKTVELCTFYVGSHQFGINILKVQEINKHVTITTVPQSQEFIIGVMNLRGRIVTVIELANKLGLASTAFGKKSRTIIVNSRDEYIGLLVDQIGDVVPVDIGKVEPPPVNIGGILGNFTEGVLKTGTGLIGILDVEEVLK